MAITPLSDNLNIISALADEPNDITGLTAAQLKAKYDEAGNKIKTYLNETMSPDIAADITAAVAAAEIQSGNIPAGGTTGQLITKKSGTDYDYEWSDPTGTSDPTADTIMKRDANGRAQVADPVAAADIATKGFVDPAIARTDRAYLNMFKTMLALTLNSTNYDAWADILNNTNWINTSASSGYQLTGSYLTGEPSYIAPTGGGQGSISFGNDPGSAKIGQSFTSTYNCRVISIRLYLQKIGFPSDSVVVKFYASDKTTLLGTSTPIVGAGIYEALSPTTFGFATAVPLTQGTGYFFAVERTGGIDISNYYKVAYPPSSAYTGGTMWLYNSGVWSDLGTTSHALDFYITVVRDATVIWNAVTSSATFSNIAVCADTKLDTTYPGTITFYISPDGTNWAEVEALDTIQAVEFTGTSVYFRVDITGDARLLGIAWGGY